MSSAIDTNPPASAPPPEASKPSFVQRLIGVIMSPGETFRSIAQRPDWVAPFFFIIIISFVAGIVVAMRVDFSTVAREAIEMSPRASQMTPDQMDTAVKFQSALLKVIAYCSPIFSALAFLIVAAVLLFSLRMFGGEGNFNQAFSVTLYAWMPRLIKGIITLVVVLTRSNLGMFELQNPVASNPGFLIDPKANLLLYTALSSIDIFSIWSLFLLIVGFAAVSRLTKGKTAGVVIGWWVVINLVSLIGPALQTIRGK